MKSGILDTRDLNELKEELEALRDAVTEAEEALKSAEDERLNLASDEGEGGGNGATREELEEAVTDAESILASAREYFGDDEKTELEELEELESDISEWRHGEALIPESEWEDYARQFAEDIGAIPEDAQWPCTCIDWEQAAKELAMDYSMVSFQGVDYYVRS